MSGFGFGVSACARPVCKTVFKRNSSLCKSYQGLCLVHTRRVLFVQNAIIDDTRRQLMTRQFPFLPIVCSVKNSPDFHNYVQMRQYYLSKSIYKEINYEEFVKLKNKGLTVVDVRNKDEIRESGTISGSINIPCSLFSSSGKNDKMPSVDEEFRHLDYNQLLELRNKERNTVLIDVREKHELDQTGVLPNSHHIPLLEINQALGLPENEFEASYNFPKPHQQDHVIFSCRSGKRSMVALEKALAQGFVNAKHYKGGWLDWEEKTVGPKEQTTSEPKEPPK